MAAMTAHPDTRETAPSDAPHAEDTGPGRSASVRSGGYWPGLDGIRGLAVLAVVIYHLTPSALPGGFLGVDLFFVLSGYLITSLLVGERDRRGRVDLPRFWLRRVRRLYPAVVALVVVLVPVAAIWDRAALASARMTFLMALTYTTNWWFIFHHVSYFQSFGPPPLLLHLWSLAIEEQYYLIWPPVLLLLLRWGRRRSTVAGLAVAAAVASAVLMGVLYHGTGSVDRVYFGSDTHAEGLLIGSALGLMLGPSHLSSHVSERARHILDRAGAIALVGLLALTLFISQSSAFTWRGGLDLAVILAGVAVVVAAHPATTTSKALSARPLLWLGTRSYSIYLWHWPVIVLTDKGGIIDAGGFTGFVFRVAVIAAVSELSSRYVEMPWRTGSAQAVLRRLTQHPVALRKSLYGATAAMAVVLALIMAVPAPTDPAAVIGTETPAAAHSVTAAAVAAAHHSGINPALTPPSSIAPRLLALHGPVLAIGDSVMLSAAPDLVKTFGNDITVDAMVGRQVSAGLTRLAAYRAAGRLRGLGALVIGLGSNGPFTTADLSQLRQLSAGVPIVVLINVRVPESWQSVSDQTIDSAAKDPGMRVVNWYGASSNRGLLWPDLIHPNPAGQKVYATLVAKALLVEAPVSTPSSARTP